MSNFIRSAVKRHRLSLLLSSLVAISAILIFEAQDLQGNTSGDSFSVDLRLSDTFCEPLRKEIHAFVQIVAERRSSIRQDLIVSSESVSRAYEVLRVWEGKSLKGVPLNFDDMTIQARSLVAGSDAIFVMAEEDDIRVNSWEKIWRSCGAKSELKEKLDLFRERNYEHLTTTADTLSLVGSRVLQLISTYEKWARKGRPIELGDFDELDDMGKGLYEAHTLIDENYNFVLAPLLEGGNR